MNIVEELDLAIKFDETGTQNGGYEVKYNDRQLEKKAYMTNDEWKIFFDAMPHEAREEYGKGGGDELSEKNGRPPKMASYGSSSRMIYTLSCKNRDFHYEKKLPTTVGGKANLDGFYEDEDHYIFVEAKCHEPYTLKKNVVSVCYEELYKFINANGSAGLYIDIKECPKECHKEIEFFAGKEKLVRFDMKQMICHLLGIATGMLKGTLSHKQTDFLYLLYDPTSLEIAGEAKVQINEIYSRACYESELVDFSKLFRVILEYLRTERHLGGMTAEEADVLASKLSFKRVSQKDYPDHIK